MGAGILFPPIILEKKTGRTEPLQKKGKRGTMMKTKTRHCRRQAIPTLETGKKSGKRWKKEGKTKGGVSSLTLTPHLKRHERRDF